uniref:F-box domain-containing protein n=1 Tax=Caenorhabditis tropicalis TaxID=1561998 RepID=A0A1I7UFN7_9PELO
MDDTIRLRHGGLALEDSLLKLLKEGISDTVKTYRKKSENVKIVVNDFENNVKVFFDNKLNCRLSLDSLYGKWKLVEREYSKTTFFGADFRLSLYCEDESEWKLKWDDPTTDGVLTLIDWATDLFRTDVWSLSVSKRTIHRLKWVESCQEHIKEVFLWAGNHTEDEIRCLFHSKANKFYLLSVPPTFDYSGILPSRTSLGLCQGFWFTPNHLMTSDFMELSVNYSILTNSNVNQFLRHWLAGGSPRLKTLSLEIKEFSLNEITRGIEGVIPNGDPRSQKYWTISGRELTFNDRMYLKRSDGVMATCSTIDYRIVRRIFVLAVWPDAKNRMPY